MFRRHVAAAALAAFALVGAPAANAQVLSQKTISVAFAGDLAREAVAQCQAKGYAVSATVLDQSGVLKAFLRADGARLMTVDVSRLKAATAVGLAIPTSVLTASVAKGGDAANILHIPGVIAAPGGVPIKVDNQVVGAIGLSGAPGGQFDEECANAALAKLADRLK